MDTNCIEPQGRLERLVRALAAANIVTLAMMTGCATDPKKNERCFLLAVAYEEQDDLAPGWYDSAATELKRCGFKFEHKAGSRGHL